MKHLFEELTTNFPTNKVCTLIWAETGLADTVYIIREGQDYPTCNNHVFDRHGLYIKSFTGPLPYHYHIMGDRPLTMENRERIINEMYLFGVPVEIKYEDGSKEITRVNGTAYTIKKYFAIGKAVNIGNGPLDNIQKITEFKLSF